MGIEIDTKILNEINKHIDAGHIFQNEEMCRHTTFRTGGPAELLVTPNAQELSWLIRACQEWGLPYTVIGNGSNVLVGDKGIDGIVIEIGKEMSGIQIDGAQVTAGAGSLFSTVSLKAAAADLAGLEFASGIPGSVGGAVVMNAGAYGGEIKDVLEQVTVVTKSGEVRTVPADELGLSYRHSNVAENGWIVTEAVFSLKVGERNEITACMDDLKSRRISKQPLEFPSAGSTFKRPPGDFAGRLIEEAGLRGCSVGGAQVSEKHCGFVINRNQASSADIKDLMQKVQETVHEKSGVMLEPEVKFMGKF